jgi:hypothetical protein
MNLPKTKSRAPAGVACLVLISGLLFAAAGPEQNVALVHSVMLPRPNTVFLREGKTSRTEVLKVFQPFDTGVFTGDLLWARWLQFRRPSAHNDRQSIVNLIVRFDGAGIVSRSVLSGDMELPGALWDSVTDPPTGIADLLALPAWYWDAIHYLKGSPTRGRLIFGNSEARFGDNRKPPRTFVLPLDSVKRIASEDSATDERLQLSLYFEGSAARVRRIKVEATPIEAARLVWALKGTGKLVKTQ